MRSKSKRKSVSKLSRKPIKNLKKQRSKAKRRSYFGIYDTEERLPPNIQLAPLGPLTRTRALTATMEQIENEERERELRERGERQPRVGSILTFLNRDDTENNYPYPRPNLASLTRDNTEYQRPVYSSQPMSSYLTSQYRHQGSRLSPPMSPMSPMSPISNRPMTSRRIVRFRRPRRRSARRSIRHR